MKKTTRKYTRKEDANALQVSGGVQTGVGQTTGTRGGSGRGKRKGRATANVNNNSAQANNIDSSRTIIASNPFDDDTNHHPMHLPPNHHINLQPPGMHMMGSHMQQNQRHHSPAPPQMGLGLHAHHSNSPHSYPMGAAGPPSGAPPPPPPPHMQQQYPPQMPMSSTPMRGPAPPPGPPAHLLSGPAPHHMHPPAGPPQSMSTPSQHPADGLMGPPSQRQPQSTMMSPPPPQRMYNSSGYPQQGYGSPPPAIPPTQMGPQMHQLETANQRNHPSAPHHHHHHHHHHHQNPPTTHQTAPPVNPPAPGSQASNNPNSDHHQHEPYNHQQQQQMLIHCAECRHQIHGNETRIMCRAGCEAYYHRHCSGLTELACEMLSREPAAEWACNRCIGSDRIPVVRMQPQNDFRQTVWL